MLAAAPETYHFNFRTSDDESLCALETRILHISHAEAGAWLIDRWEMDSFLADSVLYHHEQHARVANAPVLVRIVHLAHRLSDQPPGRPLDAHMGAICSITDSDLLTIHQGAQAQVLKAAEYLGIDLSGLENPHPPAVLTTPARPSNPVQQRLIEEVRNRALLAELSQLFSHQKDNAQLLESVRQNARIFFDLDDSVVFLIRASNQALVAACVGEQRQRLTEFVVPLGAGGVVADAIVRRSLAFLQPEGAALSLAEEQLLRTFATSCVLCLPLCAGTRCLGMLLAGIAPWRLPDLQRQEKLLLAYGAQAALALEAAAKARSDIDQRLAGVQEEHLKNSRKVVHEANNPLSIIKNYLGVLDDKLARQEPVAGELAILNDEIDRVSNIIKEFAGVTTPMVGSVFDINKVISDIVRLFRESRFLPATVQISARLPELPCETAGSVDTLKQILVNLLKNAVEALPQGGHIEIVNLGATRYDAADYFAISIRDSGPGLPTEVLANLFSPVRSTKAGENRGLGLSIVHSLVKKLNGRIDCKSSRMGTSFEILLPMRVNRTPL